MSEQPTYASLTPNQVVGLNLYAARQLRGWTQEEAAARLEPFIGRRWAKGSWSAAERSGFGERSREFTADEIAAFARAFDLPITFFLLPPGEDILGCVPAIRLPGDEEGEGEAPGQWLERLLEADETVNQRLAALFAAIPPEARTNIQRKLGERFTAYRLSVMLREIEALNQWERSLRSLADRLSLVQTDVLAFANDLAAKEPADS